MTAEVAILNKTAVALAADSAVTTGFPGKEKIYTSANKIFTLSKFAPVGAMIYGHIEHCSVPWEVLIKEYRTNIWKKRETLLTDYAVGLREFVSNPRLVTDNQQDATVFASCFSALITINANLRKKGLTFRGKNIEKTFEDMQLIVDGYPAFDFLEDISERRFVTKYGGVFQAFYDKQDGLGSDLPKAVRTQFQSLVVQSLKKQMKSSFASGVVVAGFGESEIFPTMTSHHFDGVVFNKCRVMHEENVDISRDGETMSMNAFAQEDVVKSFLNGVDDNYRNYVFSMMSGFMNEFLDDMMAEHTQYTAEERNVVRELAKPKLAESIDQFRQAMLDFCRTEYILPVEDVLRAAPKDELAHIAESLVSLTSLKRKVSGESETVGGPVDVALISKGDGFVWIKRKHYFSSDLNTHFARNYYEPKPEKQDGRAEGSKARNSSRGRKRAPSSASRRTSQ